MSAVLTLHAVPVAWIGCTALALAGAAIQVAVGAGLSVVCGPFLLLWLGSAVGVPTLLCLNLLVSVVATACGIVGVRWGDFALASIATLAGCIAASALPSFPEPVLKGMTACILIAAALPSPPIPESPPSTASVRAGVSLAGFVTGALTVWTATPGPITPVALARAGRSGSDIRRAMQPISVAGYGAALAWAGAPQIGRTFRNSSVCVAGWSRVGGDWPGIPSATNHRPSPRRSARSGYRGCGCAASFRHPAGLRDRGAHQLHRLVPRLPSGTHHRAASCGGHRLRAANDARQ